MFALRRTGLAAGAYSGYSLHAEGPEKGINLILSQPGISSSQPMRCRAIASTIFSAS